MKKLIWCLVVVTLVASLMLTGCGASAPAPSPAPSPAPAPSGPVTDLQMIGATVGSGTYAINLGTAEMWNKYVTKPTRVNVSVRPYQAITETFKALDSGLVDITWAPAAFEFFISKGIGPYTPLGKRSFYKLAAGGQACPFIITTDPTVKTIADLKGKRVAAKKPGDEPLQNIKNAYFAANNMTDDDIKLLEFVAYTDCIRMLKEGTADAGMFLSSTLNPSVEELALSKDIYFINASDAEINAVISKEPYWFQTTIPAGTYKGQDKPVSIPSHMEGYFVRLDFDQERAYEMVKALYDHFDEFSAYHATVRYFSLDHAVSITRIYHPFAPGSVKYFKEKGKWTPEHEAKQQELLKAAGL